LKTDTGLKIFWFELDHPGWDESRLEPWLSEDDRRRCARLVFPLHRRRQRVACALLRRLISEELQRPPEQLGWQRAEHGKPYLADSTCSFNLSHSEGYAGLVIGHSGPLGLDLEDRRRRVEFLRLGQRFFAPPEALQLSQSQHPRHFFFEIWTAKEAYIKALGDGLSHPLDQFLTYHQGSWGLFDLQGQPLPWALVRPPCPFSEVSAALVCPQEGPVQAYLCDPEGHWSPWP
jgi:4'-phosphopantetheinyl transferase